MRIRDDHHVSVVRGLRNHPQKLVICAYGACSNTHPLRSSARNYFWSIHSVQSHPLRAVPSTRSRKPLPAHIREISIGAYQAYARFRLDHQMSGQVDAIWLKTINHLNAIRHKMVNRLTPRRVLYSANSRPDSASPLRDDSAASSASACASVSERISIFQPVNRAARRAFCPSRPMARESW